VLALEGPEPGLVAGVPAGVVAGVGRGGPINAVMVRLQKLARQLLKIWGSLSFVLKLSCSVRKSTICMTCVRAKSFKGASLKNGTSFTLMFLMAVSNPGDCVRRIHVLMIMYTWCLLMSTSRYNTSNWGISR